MKSWPSRIGSFPVAGCMVAVGGTVAFALIRELAEPWLHGQAALSPFVLVVVAAGALGGLHAGLLATLATAVAFVIYFPHGSEIGIDSTAEALLLASFVLTGLLISAGCEALARSQRRLGKEIDDAKRAEAELKETNASLHFLAEDAQHLLAAESGEAFLEQTFAGLRELFQVDFCFHYRVVEGERSLRLAFHAGVSAETAERLRHLAFGEAVCGTVAEHRELMVLADVRDSRDACTSLIRGLGAQAYVCHPLLLHGDLRGTLSFGSARTASFSARDLAIFEAVAHQAALAIERLALIDALKARAQELADVARRKDEFLALLGHEMRNPLAPIRNGIEAVRAAVQGNPVLDRATSMMQRQCEQLIRLIDDLLDVSRINQGKLHLRRRTMTLAEAIDTAVEAVRPLTEATGQHLAIDLPEQPLYLEADPARIAQVLINLLNNASKFTDAGGRISLSVAPEGGAAVIRVSDTGIGIAADALERIFGMFTQADSSARRSHGGLGIGLTLVKRLTEMHGGSVEAHSDGPGLGSEFVVRLPLHPAVPALAVPAAESRESSRSAGALRILVVDDDRDVADSLRVFLELKGHEVASFNNGQDALAALAGFHPDVLLCDVGMLGMSGLEVARQVRERRPEGIFLIALSGYGTEADVQGSLAAGFDLHLIKPVDPLSLLQVLSGISRPAPAPVGRTTVRSPLESAGRPAGQVRGVC